jgi:hypothetical protein
MDSKPLPSPKRDLIRVGWDLDSVKFVGDKLSSSSIPSSVPCAGRKHGAGLMSWVATARRAEAGSRMVAPMWVGVACVS